MSKSVLYTVNSSNQDVLIDGVISPGTIIRRFGCNATLSGNAIRIIGPGYYDIRANFTLEPTTTDPFIITLYKDGVAIPGATASGVASAAGDPVTVSIDAIVKEYCQCCDDASSITAVLTGSDATVTNMITIVEKY